MKIVVLQACAFWDASNGRLELVPGTEAIEVPEEHALTAVREGWATPEDAESGAPPREKQSARRAPERK